MMKPLSPPGSLLVVCLRYLGDSLLLQPVLLALHRTFPSARLDVLVSEGTSCAIGGCPGIGRVREWPRSVVSQAALLASLPACGYDWLVDYTGNDRSALVSLCSLARHRIAYEHPLTSRFSIRRLAYNVRPPYRKVRPHIVTQRLELIEACGVPPMPPEFCLIPDAGALAWAEREIPATGAPRLAVHITSRDLQKAIPQRIARTVLESASAAGWEILATCGNALQERNYLRPVVEGLPRTRVLDDISWQQLVAVIASAGKFWGADTGPAHIASALGKPMLVHFGPSRSEHWHPLHAAGKYETHFCECLRKKSGACPKNKPGRCLESIDPSAVVLWIAGA